MKKIAFYTILKLFPLVCFGLSSVNFRIEGNIQKMILDFQKKILISEKCYTGGFPNNCEPFKLINSELKKFKGLTTTSYNIGGRNPGSFICEDILGLSIVLGQNITGRGDNAFCRFEDGNLLDTGSLFYYWNINTQKI